MIQEHPNFATIQTFVDSLIINIRNKQADYFAKNKKYFQGLRIPSQGTLDGGTEALIDFGRHPSDQEDSWYTFDNAKFKANVKFPIHVQIDIYETPTGWGWILRCELWKDGLGPDAYGHDGNHWVFQHNEGPSNSVGIWNDWHIEEEMP